MVQIKSLCLSIVVYNTILASNWFTMHSAPETLYSVLSSFSTSQYEHHLYRVSIFEGSVIELYVPDFFQKRFAWRPKVGSLEDVDKV